MKNLLIAILTILTFNLFAQDITKEWLPNDGDQLTRTFASNPDDFEVPKAGMDQTWDYSSAISSAVSTVKTLSTENLEFADKFPDANVAFVSGVDDDFQLYYVATDNAFYRTGFTYLSTVDGVQSRKFIYYDNGSDKVNFPFTFGDSWIHEFNSYQLLNGIPSDFKNRKENLAFEGIGTVITPEGTYTDCIMIKRDFLNLDDELLLRQYVFYQNSLSNIVLEYAITPLSDGNVLYWQSGFSSGTTSIETIPLGFNIIQTAKHQFNIESNEFLDLDIQIIDINGRVHQQLNAPILRGENRIDIKEFDINGIYFMVLCDKNSGRFFTYKFSNF